MFRSKNRIILRGRINVMAASMQTDYIRQKRIENDEKHVTTPTPPQCQLLHLKEKKTGDFLLSRLILHMKQKAQSCCMFTKQLNSICCFRYIDSTIPLFPKSETIACGCTDGFVSNLVGNPEDRCFFSLRVSAVFCLAIVTTFIHDKGSLKGRYSAEVE